MWAAGTAVVVVALANQANAEPAATGRLAGPTRYETAVAVSRATFPDGSPEIIVARGDLYPDALVASFLASLLNGHSPVLLTEPNRLPPAVAAELPRLDAQRAWIMGDESAVSARVEAEIRATVTDVRRVAGATRYETAFALTAMVGESRTHAFVVSGQNHPDALAVGALANRRSIPIILTTPDTLHPAARRSLQQLAVTDVYVVGGTGAISDEVVAELRALRTTPEDPPLRVTRIAGADRFGTAAAVADLALGPVFDLDATHVDLVRGDGFADAIAAGPHGGAEGAVTLFVRDRDDLGEASRAWLREHAATITTIHAIGDEGVISDAVLADAARAAG